MPFGENNHVLAICIVAHISPQTLVDLVFFSRFSMGREVGLSYRSYCPLLDTYYSFLILSITASPSRKPIQDVRLDEGMIQGFEGWWWEQILNSVYNTIISGYFVSYI